LLLSVVMGNYRNLLLVFANLPFALVGGVFAAYLTGGVLSIGSPVGFVTLFGITLRNSIMMITHYEHLVIVEGVSWGWDAAIRGAMERLIPILMTATVTGLALLPLAIGSGDPGREIEEPMAIVILGGLFTIGEALRYPPVILCVANSLFKIMTNKFKYVGFPCRDIFVQHVVTVVRGQTYLGVDFQRV
jgi:Cu/Ag efflux pump CusA